MLGRSVLRVKLLYNTVAPFSPPNLLIVNIQGILFLNSYEDKTHDSISPFSYCTLLHKVRLEFPTRS
jgi:hypothetical protein